MKENINYLAHFLTSKDHMWLAVLTLGVGLVSASGFGLLLGVGAYALGWVYLPGMSFFRNKVDNKIKEEERAKEEQAVWEFREKRDAQLRSLTPAREDKYSALADVCQNIEQSAQINSAYNGYDPVVKKLDELMWTYLRLLVIEQSLHVFLESERRDDLQQAVEQCVEDVMATETELHTLEGKASDTDGDPLTSFAFIETKRRLLNSKRERLAVLRKRQERVYQAKGNIEIILAEQQRLEEQIKLLRADAIATKNADALTSRIDASIENLGQTNEILSQMDDFKDVVGDMPMTVQRVGFGGDRIKRNRSHQQPQMVNLR